MKTYNKSMNELMDEIICRDWNDKLMGKFMCFYDLIAFTFVLVYITYACMHSASHAA